MSDNLPPAEGSDAERVARQLGRSARRLSRAAREASRTARPRVEQIARDASERARPLSARAVQFLREHDSEIKQAGATGARVVASRAGPPLLRPVVTAMTDQLIRRPPVPYRDPNVRPQADEPPAEAARDQPPRNFF